MENIPPEPKKTKDIKSYMKAYYQNNKLKYLERNRQQREKTRPTNPLDKFKLKIIDSNTMDILFDKNYPTQREIALDLRLPQYTVCRIYKNNNHPNYQIILL